MYFSEMKTITYLPSDQATVT